MRSRYVQDINGKTTDDIKPYLKYCFPFHSVPMKVEERQTWDRIEGWGGGGIKKNDEGPEMKWLMGHNRTERDSLLKWLSPWLLTHGI